jgi:hypothetical protein
MLKAARFNSLVLLLSKFRQPIRGGPEIVTQHRTSGDNLVLDCLLDQLVLADA